MNLKNNETKTQIELATLAINKKLYVLDWNMENQYSDIIEYGEKSNYWLTILFDEDLPIGAATLQKKEKSLNIYILPECRGKNLGVQLIEKILDETKLTKQDVHAFIGEDGTEKFYRKAGIACFVDEISMTKKEHRDFLSYKLSYEELVKKKIRETLNKYKKNIDFPDYQKRHPRSVNKI